MGDLDVNIVGGLGNHCILYTERGLRGRGEDSLQRLFPMWAVILLA